VRFRRGRDAAARVNSPVNVRAPGGAQVVRWSGEKVFLRGPAQLICRESSLADQVIKPPALKKGDKIGIIAPASSFSREGFAAGCDRLRQMGYFPVFSNGISTAMFILPAQRSAACVNWKR